MQGEKRFAARLRLTHRLAKDLFPQSSHVDTRRVRVDLSEALASLVAKTALSGVNECNHSSLMSDRTVARTPFLT